ncbi:capsular polysaccharide export protein, LipB/KpsS family [Halomarina oriensis]|uniref:Capsule biosynthesis protein n=1 Tax=Halomarina oriensis TaxID=671145 RepID=A0A6B0GW05_9EURY|nr:hypothetical protein [Halomarina oriensis]MWG36325.1 hypothetical protein [Halomarina oriensis]
MLEPLYTLPRASFEAASRLGMGRPMLELFDGVVGMPRYDFLGGVDERIRSYEPDSGAAKGVVLFPVFPAFDGVLYRACILAHAFRTRGYRPVMLDCKRDCDTCQFEDCLYEMAGEVGPTTPVLCRMDSHEIPAAFGLETWSLGEVLDDGYEPPVVPLRPDATYRKVPVGQYALASARKFLKKHHLDLDTPVDRSVFGSYLRTATTLADVYHSLFADDLFDVVVTNETVYVHGGVPLSVADAYGVSGYSHDVGYQDGSIVFGNTGNRNTEPYFSDDAVVEAFLAEPLDEDQERALTAAMDERSGGEGTFLFSSMADVSVETPADHAVAGMFTNLVWDASLQVGPDDVAFDDVFDWVAATVDDFLEHDDRTLVIKTHPAELDIGTNEDVTTWIRRRYGELPSNVHLLPPDTAVNTYQLMRDIDVGLTYTTTVGIEMAYTGLPVVVAGEACYRGYGFTVDPDSPAAYVERLHALEDLTLTEEQRARARRFAYYALVHQCFPFPYVSVDMKRQQYQYHPVAHDELTPGNEPFDTIVGKMSGGDPVVPGDRTDSV